MKAKELEKKVQETSNKIKLLCNIEDIQELEIEEYVQILSRNLCDDEIVEVLIQLKDNLYSYEISEIIKTISDSKIKLKILKDDTISSPIENGDIADILTTMDTDDIKSILTDEIYWEKRQVNSYFFQSIIEKAHTAELLEDKEFIKKIKIGSFQLSTIIKSMQSEDEKKKMIDVYGIENFELISILQTFSDHSKKQLLLKNKYNLDKYQVITLLQSFNVTEIAKLIKEEPFFFKEHDIKIYKLAETLSKEKQLEFIELLEETGLEMSQKRMIMPYLNEEIKDILRDKDIPQEYKTALSFKPIEKVSPTSYNKIEIDLSKAPEEYIGLDEILYINPQRINSKDIPKLKKVLELCPRVKLGDDMEIGTSTVQEYIEGEEWITSVLDKVNPEWTDLQKLAYIDNAIGKKVSYSPDFDTERFSHADSRILWRIISTGYGVCNRNS